MFIFWFLSFCLWFIVSFFLSIVYSLWSIVYGYSLLPSERRVIYSLCSVVFSPYWFNNPNSHISKRICSMLTPVFSRFFSQNSVLLVVRTSISVELVHTLLTVQVVYVNVRENASHSVDTVRNFA